jgi:hypothetical protein
MVLHLLLHTGCPLFWAIEPPAFAAVVLFLLGEEAQGHVHGELLCHPQAAEGGWWSG